MAVPSAITDLSTTVASNSPAGSESPSLIDDYLRAQAGFLAQMYSGNAPLLASVAGTDTITGTVTPTPTAYAAGQVFRFIAAGANTTTAVTLNVSSLGAKSVTKLGANALAAGDIPSGAVVEVVYDGTRFQIIGLTSQIAAAINTMTSPLTITVNGTTPITADTSGNISLPLGTANQVQYLNGSKVLSGSANLTFDGTTLTPNALTVTNAVTLNGGTANGVPYLNASKVLTSGSALTWNGSTFFANGTIQQGNGGASTIGKIWNDSGVYSIQADYTNVLGLKLDSGGYTAFTLSNSEQMRLTSTGLGIGTSSPGAKLHIIGTSSDQIRVGTAATEYYRFGRNASTGLLDFYGSQTGYQGYTFGGVDGTWMTLNASGNLGLGVTPSAQRSGFVGLQVGQGSVILANKTETGTNLLDNAYLGAAVYQYIANGYASEYTQYQGQHQWFTAPSGTAGGNITFTQAMTLDASSNLMVGTTTSSGRLTVMGDGTANASILVANSNRSTTNAGVLSLYGYNASVALKEYGRLYSTIDTNTAGSEAGSMVFQTINAGTLAERARIDASGNLLINTTSTTLGTDTANLVVKGFGASGYAIAASKPASGGISYIMKMVYDNTTGTGQITTTNTTVSYATSSDYRLKENVQPMTGALAKVAALNPVTYTWKADGSTGEGFIAHELAEVVPQCVTGEKDAVDADGNPQYQGIDTSFLVATLTAAIQEQQALIESLTARVQALEAK